MEDDSPPVLAGTTGQLATSDTATHVDISASQELSLLRTKAVPDEGSASDFAPKLALDKLPPELLG